ncbi:MAG: glycosyltransferase family 4 protein [Dehalobacter sp.]|nr:glycosyltransferase family 4 protein [Dehalobacter sp.]
MDKSKILMIGGFGPTHIAIGGGQLIAYNLFKSLRNQGIYVDYLAIDSEYDNLLKPYNVINSNSITYKQLKAFLKTNLDEYNIIHIHSANELQGILIGLIIKKIKKPRLKIVLSIHSPETYVPPRSSVELFNIILSRFSNQVFSLSQYSKKSMCKNYGIPDHKIKVTYTGVDDLYLSHSKKSDYSFSNKYKLLFVGRYGDKNQQKGLDILINALSLITKELNVELRVIGPGKPDLYYPLIDRLNLREHIKFLGIKRGDSLIHEYLDSDLFVLPSRRESFGIVLAEAMSLGLPVVSTNVGAIPEVVKNNETGLLVPANDPVTFANAVVHLLIYPNIREEMGKKGISWVYERYTMNTMADKVIEYYKEIL